MEDQGSARGQGWGGRGTVKDTAPDGPHSRAHEREGLHVKPETKLGSRPSEEGGGWGLQTGRGRGTRTAAELGHSGVLLRQPDGGEKPDAPHGGRAVRSAPAWQLLRATVCRGRRSLRR